MASRLSNESLMSAFDRGLANFNWQVANLPSPIDEERGARAFLNGLLETEDAESLVQAVEPSLIRHVLLTAGIEDHLEILPLLSTDQMTHIMDFEGWNSNQISASGAARWLQLHKEANPKELFRRFRDLEEEFQMGLLGPLVETFDLDAYEKMNDVDQDDLQRLPCGEVFYKIKSEDPEVRVFIEELIAQALGRDIEYTYSMLAHASYLPPNEQEALALRFRDARLEEEGFVKAEDAARLFLVSPGEDAIHRWTGSNVAQFVERLMGESINLLAAKEVAIAEAGTAPNTAMTIESALAACGQDAAGPLAVSLSHLANTLAVITGVESTNREGQRLVLAHTKGYCNLGLELLGIASAVQILSAEHPATLFKTSIAVMDEIRRRTLDTLEMARLMTPETAQHIRRLLFSRKYGIIMTTLDLEALPLIGFEATEILKGLFNRFPLCPVINATGERMTFKPAYDVRTLAELLRWIDQVKKISPTVH